MFDRQLQTFAALIRDKDLQQYAGEAFWNFIKACLTEDVDARIKTGDSVMTLILHTPTVLFWDKMRRYLYGTFRNYEEQVKMAEKFSEDHEKYREFVKRQIHFINEIDDDKKVDYFAALTRCYLLTDMEEAVFQKLTKFITLCTPAELEFLQSVPETYTSAYTVMISSLYQFGLFAQKETEEEITYALSDFAKALKQNCLNFEEGLQGQKRMLSYRQINPPEIAEPATAKDMETMWNQTGFRLDGGNAAGHIELE